MKQAIMQRTDLGEIRPHGWLKNFLNTQANGLTGRLHETGYPYSIGFWKGETRGDETPPWEVFEQTAYLLDGMYSCGVLTGREDLVKRADESFEYALSHIAPDGFIGSDALRAESGWHRWPHVVFFRALIAKYENTHDERIVRAIADHYLKGEYDYSTKREFLNIEIMLWAYGITNDARLLALAEKTYADYNRNCTDDNCEKVMLSEKKPYAHGVTYDETAKIGAILYLYTGNKRYLQASVHAFEKLEKMFLLADGGHCSNEFMIGNDTLQSHETCTVTDYTWALMYLLTATGNVDYADKIEKCIFNAGIGSVNEDFTAVQYFSCPNQVLTTENSNHNAFFCGTGWMRYNAKHFTDCCAGNCNRFMPNFCKHLWFRNDNDIFAALYSPNTYAFEIDGKRVEIEERTAYPFEDKIEFTVRTEKDVTFALNLRIPAWTHGATVSCNGDDGTIAERGRFYKLERTFHDGDTVVLRLDPQIEMKNSADGGVYFQRGPLVFGLGIERKEVVTQNADTQCKLPNREFYPLSAWNYGVKKSDVRAESIRLVKKQMCENPWTLRNAPLRLQIPARKIPAWQIEHRTRVERVVALYEKKTEMVDGDFDFTPPLPPADVAADMGEKEVIELVPLGAAKLRITVFPVAE